MKTYTLCAENDARLEDYEDSEMITFQTVSLTLQSLVWKPSESERL